MFDITDKITAGTGHRLADTPAGYNRFHPWKLEKLKILEDHLKNFRPCYIISGGALGFDQFLIYIALKLKIPYAVYIPCENQESRWNDDHKKQYRRYLDKADKIVYVSKEPYKPYLMQRRNEAMLRDSEAVLALYNDAKRHGGTYNCITAAHKLKLPVINFWGKTPEILECRL